MIISGQDVITEQPKEVTIQSEDVRAALIGPCEEMVIHIKETFKEDEPGPRVRHHTERHPAHGRRRPLVRAGPLPHRQAGDPGVGKRDALTNVVTGCLKVLETPTALKQTLMRSK